MDRNNDFSLVFNNMRKKRNTIFLFMCFVVHIGYFISFFVLSATPLYTINAISALIYILLLLFCNNIENTEKTILFSYFEIILFSTYCSVFTRNTFGFIYFTIGMVTVIFNLCPSYGDRRFLFQIIGVIAALFIHNSNVLISDNSNSQVYESIKPYSQIYSFINLLITMFTILYTSFFYKLELDMVKKELDYRSTHDPLTKLHNRRFLYDTVISGNDRDISVVILDIDNFKKINDRFGHDVGDEVLVKLSACIREESEDDIYPIRWGGEEFVIYYKGLDVESAYKKASEIHQMISEKVSLPDDTHITVTMGLASGKQSEFDSVIKKADDYLYMGKRNGKNCIIWYGNEVKLQ